jgi:DNA-binding HxlR family transcriptional regulator
MPDAAAPIDGEVRAGSRVLSLFANPLNARILRAHLGSAQRLADLPEKVGYPAQTTLRAALANLREVGALAKHERGGSRFATENELTAAGEEMLFVADVVERWLARAPEGPIAPDSDAAKGAVKALAGGWTSTVMRALASGAFTLTELDRLIPGVSYPSLERRLARMRATGQIEPVETEGRGRPYLVTDWLRRAIGPLCAAGRCERRHLPDDSAPITKVEVEAAFLLSVPLAPMPPSANGACMLAVQTGTGDPESQRPGEHLAGVTVEFERGQAVSFAARVNERPATWALGTPETWLDVVIDGELESLRFGGAKPQLAVDLVNGIHFALFRE